MKDFSAREPGEDTDRGYDSFTPRMHPASENRHTESPGRRRLAWHRHAPEKQRPPEWKPLNGLQRFAANLPPVDQFVTLGEGNTPTVFLPRLARTIGIERLSAKMESQNPTGSYKDRVAAMSMSLALTHGFRGWIATSSGNAGLSFAAYGARAGLPGFLCLVSTAPAEKKLALLPYGINMASMSGIGDDADRRSSTEMMSIVQSAAERHKLFLGITANAFNPGGMRGIDTISYELTEQADPTHTYVPTGGGGLVSSIARGFADCLSPSRVIACQPSGCAPITRFLSGEIDEPAIDRCTTSISALQLPHPPDGLLAAKSVRESGGWGCLADDDEILHAQRLLAETEGIFVEPASAATLAALIKDLESGRVRRMANAALVMTGAGWKDLARFGGGERHEPALSPDHVAARIDHWADSF